MPAIRTLALALTALLTVSSPARESALPRAVTPRGPLAPSEQQVVRLFEAAAPSVAYITSEVVEAVGWFDATVSRSAGGGFIWDTSGHIVTNNHNVQGARRLFVQLDVGQSIPATLVGRSPEYDLAVFKLVGVPRNLRPIPLGSSKDLRISQTVYVVGNPTRFAADPPHARQAPSASFAAASTPLAILACCAPG